VGVIPTSLLILAGALTELEIHKLPLHKRITWTMRCVPSYTDGWILDCYISLFLRKKKQFVFDSLEQKMPIRVLVTLYSRFNMNYFAWGHNINAKWEGACLFSYLAYAEFHWGFQLKLM